MKVGIVTLMGGDNYGNVLQNYAVQEVLKELGAEPETINNKTRYGMFVDSDEPINKVTISYVKKYIVTQLSYRYNIKNTDSSIFGAVMYYKRREKAIEKAKKEREDSFNRFRESLIVWSKDSLDINKPWSESQIATYDYYVSGSDQVWNPNHPKTSSINFLQFAPEYKRIAFSPSFGITKIPDSVKSKYAKWINSIPSLSVREEQGRKIIKDLCGRDACVFIDPTMVLEREKWEDIEEKPQFLDEREYVLTYFLGNRTKEYQHIIQRYADKKNLKIINLYDIRDLKYYSVSPQEFVYLINHAMLVCTDSFHGAAFSIVMHTAFVTFPRIEQGNSMESRIKTLLETFCLESREYRNIQEEGIYSIDFSKVDPILNKKKKEAIEFLKNAMSSNTERIDESSVKVKINNSLNKCCGCRACEKVCPTQCIEMKNDTEGFLYPVVNHEKCIHCNKCQKICPVENAACLNRDFKQAKCYVAYSNDKEVRKNSSSGGLFTELARVTLRNSGVVYGAGFRKDFSVAHIGVSDINELESLRTSKYVQSDTGNVYVEVRRNLSEGKRVYFSGTPCQVSGLYRFLSGQNMDHLITQDVICHGVPSPLVWKYYIGSYKDIKQVSFRDKKYGWHYFSMKIKSKSGKYVKRLDEDFYMRLFLDNTILRPICYECPFKSNNSGADITIADCWNVGYLTNEIKDTDKGLSLVIIQSDKGQKVWEDITRTSSITCVEVDSEAVFNSQLTISRSAECNGRRNQFFEALQDSSVNTLKSTWYKKSLKKDLKKRVIFIKTKIRIALRSIKD